MTSADYATYRPGYPPARRLQVGDPGGNKRRALAHFPYPEIAARVLDRYFIEGGKEADAPFMVRLRPRRRVKAVSRTR